MNSRLIPHLSEIRSRAREHILEGAVTAGYQADRTQVVALLNEALATELVCVLRYKAHQFLARGIQAKPVAEEFLEHAAEEQQHADRIAERITQLGGDPDFNPRELADRSASEYSSGGSLVQMLEEDLVAERIAIDTYREMIAFVEGTDSSTRRMLEEILAVEEEHARELSDLLATMDPTQASALPTMERTAKDG